MLGLLEIGCEHYVDEWEEVPIAPRVLPRALELEAYDIGHQLRPKPGATITEWLVQTSKLYRTASIPLEERFRQQADKWRRETEHLSSPTQMMMHPSYQAILGMAQENKDLVIRLLLRDLEENRGPWFWALSYLTQDNPIKQKDAGKIDKMIKAWVIWAKERNLL